MQAYIYMNIIATLYSNLSFETNHSNQNVVKLLNTTDMSLEFCRNLGAGCFEGFIQLHRSLIMSLILMQVQGLLFFFWKHDCGS